MEIINSKSPINLMNRNQRLNYNSSLLIHSLSKSEANLSNPSFHRKSCSNLLTQLNMTYSRLTTETKHDLKQNQPVSRETQYDLQNLSQTQSPTLRIDHCPNCNHMRNQLKQVQYFLLQMENQLVEKQHLLSDKYRQIKDQLAKKNKQLHHYQNQHKKLQHEILLFKQIHNLPKLQLNTNLKPPKLFDSICQTTKHRINTLQSTNDIDNKRPRNILKKNTYFSSFQQTQKENQDQPIINDSQFLKKSVGSSVQLSYALSERQNSNIFISTKDNTKEKNGLEVSQNALKTHNDTKKYYELSKLRFQNASLKSYNSVLQEHVKPKKLAEKVFALRKN